MLEQSQKTIKTIISIIVVSTVWLSLYFLNLLWLAFFSYQLLTNSQRLRQQFDATWLVHVLKTIILIFHFVPMSKQSNASQARVRHALKIVDMFQCFYHHLKKKRNTTTQELVSIRCLKRMRKTLCWRPKAEKKTRRIHWLWSMFDAIGTTWSGQNLVKTCGICLASPLTSCTISDEFYDFCLGEYNSRLCLTWDCNRILLWAKQDRTNCCFWRSDIFWGCEYNQEACCFLMLFVKHHGMLCCQAKMKFRKPWWVLCQQLRIQSWTRNHDPWPSRKRYTAVDSWHIQDVTRHSGICFQCTFQSPKRMHTDMRNIQRKQIMKNLPSIEMEGFPPGPCARLCYTLAAGKESFASCGVTQGDWCKAFFSRKIVRWERWGTQGIKQLWFWKPQFWGFACCMLKWSKVSSGDRVPDFFEVCTPSARFFGCFVGAKAVFGHRPPSTKVLPLQPPAVPARRSRPARAFARHRSLLLEGRAIEDGWWMETCFIVLFGWYTKVWLLVCNGQVTNHQRLKCETKTALTCKLGQGTTVIRASFGSETERQSQVFHPFFRNLL